MNQRRQQVALLILGVAFGAFAAAPALHQIGHEDDHVHVGGAIVPIDTPERANPTNSDDEAPADEPAPSVPHGAGGLAHLSMAVLIADIGELFTAALPSVSVPPSWPALLPRAVTKSIHLARGPPSWLR